MHINRGYPKPTGSTTCALIDFSYRINCLLEANRHVRCVFIDFTQAFDRIDHFILISKLLDLDIPQWLIRWIASFLSDRTQATKVDFVISRLLRINRSIIQGSGLGPILFLIYASDLKTLDVSNYLLKYADDSTLINPETAKTSLEEEMSNIMSWASINKMLINLIKTKEIVFTRPNPRMFNPPLPLDGIARVSSFKLLGVSFNSVLNFQSHIDNIVATGNQRIYLIQQLKKQGLNIKECDVIFQSLVLGKLTYALPMFYGYLTEHSRGQINALLRKAKRYQLTDTEYNIDEIASKLQRDLFLKSTHAQHCLHHIYELNDSQCAMTLRPRGHCFKLPFFKYECNKRGFIARCLYMYS